MQLTSQLKPTTTSSDPSPSTSNTPVKSLKNHVKLMTPSDFNGDRTMGHSFLNSCRLYIKLCPEHFMDEQAQILWALSYMKTGWAVALANHILQNEATLHQPFYCSWADFEHAFKIAFCPRNKVTVTLTKLELTSYFQGQHSVDEYIDSFSDLIVESGYYDDHIIVMKFHRGLD
jgi:hypothetical protein